MYELDFWTIKWSLPQVPDQHIITEFLSYLRNLIETLNTEIEGKARTFRHYFTHEEVRARVRTGLGSNGV